MISAAIAAVAVTKKAEARSTNKIRRVTRRSSARVIFSSMTVMAAASGGNCGAEVWIVTDFTPSEVNAFTIGISVAFAVAATMTTIRSVPISVGVLKPKAA